MNPAPKLIQQLLHDIMVWCESCTSSIKAIDYTSHCCSTVRKQEMQLVSKVVHHAQYYQGELHTDSHRRDSE